MENIIIDIFSLFIKSSQDEFRVYNGLPKIGEGWISETELFRLLESEFDNLNVIHHGKPSWLGKQHVDIWFPEYKIGIEYQGKQHFEPIEFFGGLESFNKNKLRDERKRNLFRENNAILIEVMKGYDIEGIYAQIKKIISQGD